MTTIRVQAGVLLGESPHERTIPNWVHVFHTPPGRSMRALPAMNKVQAAFLAGIRNTTKFARSQPGKGRPRLKSTDEEQLRWFHARRFGFEYIIATDDTALSFRVQSDGTIHSTTLITSEKDIWLQTLREMSDKYFCGGCGALCETFTCSRSVKLANDTWQQVDVHCFDCDRAAKFEQYAQSKHITTGLMMDASLMTYDGVPPDRLARSAPEVVADAREIVTSLEAIKQHVVRFKHEVWANGMQQTVRKSKASGMSAKFKHAHEEVKILTLCSAGRCLMTLDTPTHDITFITLDDEAVGSVAIQGIHASEQQATTLIDATIAAFADGKIKLKDDSKVSM